MNLQSVPSLPQMERSFRQNLRKELAAKSEIAKSAIDSYFGKHDSMPPADTAARLADKYGADFIITGNTNDFTFPLYKLTKIVTPKDYWENYKPI